MLIIQAITALQRAGGGTGVVTPRRTSRPWHPPHLALNGEIDAAWNEIGPHISWSEFEGRPAAMEDVRM